MKIFEIPQSAEQNGLCDNLPSNEQSSCDERISFCEISSASSVDQDSHLQPKKGVLSRFNQALKRIFRSKLWFIVIHFIWD